MIGLGGTVIGIGGATRVVEWFGPRKRLIPMVPGMPVYRSVSPGENSLPGKWYPEQVGEIQYSPV